MTGHGRRPRRRPFCCAAITPPMPTDAALIKLVGSPDLCSKRWIYEQYDSLILGNTIQGPGGDAAVMRLGDGPKGLALTTDCTQRYCEADPREGGKQAVAEAWRNLIAVGARPIALTDNLNFGNPENRKAMGQFVGCIEGIGEAARALDFPIVSGNVSLYNETMGSGIPPTPAIGGVGLLDDVAKAATLAFKAAGDVVLLVGEAGGWLGRSAWLVTVADGRKARRRRSIWRPSGATASLCLASFGMAVSAPCTTSPTADSPSRWRKWRWPEASAPRSRRKGPVHGFLFGEDQGRYVLTAAPGETAAIANEAKRLGVPLLADWSHGRRRLAPRRRGAAHACGAHRSA